MSEVQTTLFNNASLSNIETDEVQADSVTQIEDGQFTEAKAIAISPSKLSHTISAFANTDGGDLYIGIDEQLIGGNVKKGSGLVSLMLRRQTAICQPLNAVSHLAGTFSMNL